MVADLMTRVYGSDDLFPDDRIHAFRPPQSVNYVSCHDGMTMYDLVSYKTRNNWANGHGNRDGSDEFRCNCDWEGDEAVPDEVIRSRKQLIKNYFAILMLSNGTPMFRMGDECLRTQHGNNNPFNQDNETTWMDWQRLEEHPDIFRFFQMMIAFRKSHPSISRSRFWREDVRWYGINHDADLSHQARAIAWCLHGSSQNDTDLYVMVNSNDCEMEFGIHEGVLGQWRRVIDTSLRSGRDIVDEPNAPGVNANTYTVDSRSVVALVKQ